MDNDNYQPISCSDYDIYEIAIMRGQKLQVNWLDTQGQSQQNILKPFHNASPGLTLKLTMNIS